MDLRLKKTKTLISGSSRGIGLETARVFAEEGSDLWVTGRDSKNLIAAVQKIREVSKDCEINHSNLDFSQYSQVENLKDLVKSSWKKLDNLVLNVGDGRSLETGNLDSPEEFERVFSTNFKSTLYAIETLLPLVQKSSNGAITLVSSIAGIEAFGAPVYYSVAKSSLISLSKNLAKRYKVYGVRFNTIAPGNIFFESGAWEKKLIDDQTKVEKLIDEVCPMSRFGSTREIASSIAFLSSPISSFTNGALLTIDGGQSNHHG